MSYLKSKSEQNLFAAEMLIKEGLHAPSVHCSYYSSLQLSKYALKEFFGLDYGCQEEELNELKQSKAGIKGSHEYIIYRLGSQIRGCSKEVYLTYTTNIKILRKFRTESDYFDTPVTDEQSKESLRLSKQIIQLLRSNCHL